MKWTLRIVATRFARNGVVISGGEKDTNRPMEGDVVQVQIYDKEMNWNTIPSLGEEYTLKLGFLTQKFKVVNAGHEEESNRHGKRVVVLHHLSRVQAAMGQCNGMDTHEIVKTLHLLLAEKRHELEDLFCKSGFTRRFGPSTLERFDGIC